MAITNKYVQTLNTLSGNGFVFSLDRYPNVTYTTQEVNLPGVQIDAKMQSSPVGFFYTPGDKLQYQTFVINFIVDESLNNWREIYNWMRALAPTHVGDGSDIKSQYVSLKSQGLITTGRLSVLSNNLNLNVNITYHDMIPIFLDGISLSVTETDNTIRTAKASFVYSYYDIETNPILNYKSVENNIIN